MKLGMYVRIPIRTEFIDIEYPRTFALAQIEKIDSLSNSAKVIIHDLNDCKQFYEDVFKVTDFALEDIVRCRVPIGSIVFTPEGSGILHAITSTDNRSLDIYHVGIKGKEIEDFNEFDIKADFTCFDMDPVEMLKRYEFQNPSWFASRNIVASTMHVLNNAVYGFKILAGCRVFLLPHQVVTILRCLEKMPIRYMLADEVGLGKTIEACSIVKIMQERNPSIRFLYILPIQIRDQWKYELANKFSIKTVPYTKGANESNVMITIDQLKAIDLDELTSENFDFIIVDETHNILEDDLIYERIKLLSNLSKHVLLLSATPIQDRSEEYLRLLQLLDPKLYSDMPISYFSSLVERQKEIQNELYLLLGDFQAYSEYAESIIDQLNSLAERLEDSRLIQLISEIDLNTEDKGIAIAYQAAAYISEHYRIERHVIRNRRVLLKEKMAVRELVENPYEMFSINELYGEADAINSLIDWLGSINNNTLEFAKGITVPLLEAAFSSPWALQSRLDKAKEKGVKLPQELIEYVSYWKRSAEGELLRIDELLDENPDEIKGRLVRCLDYLEQQTDLTSNKRPFKVLIFSQFTETADKFFTTACNRFGSEVCRGFYNGMTEDELQDSAEAFQSQEECRILVCDCLGGEGRNFQTANMVVHLDTPWTANTLEQRIGRLDRLGRNPDKPVISVVFYVEESIEEQLVSLWKDGMKIYEQSLSGLEIITGKMNSDILEALAMDVRDGLSLALPSIQDETNSMREAVEEEQFYDLASMLYRPLTIAVERMLEMYQGKEDTVFSQAMESWSDQAGFRATVEPENKSNLTLIEFSSGRFSPKSSTNAFMVPPAWKKYTINPSVIRKGRIVGTFDRALAITREDLLFYAPGDPIFDTITSNAMSCYRGRVCAVEVDQAPFDYRGLVYIWNVEPDIYPILANRLDPSILAQFRTFLPMEQIVTLYPINEKYSGVKPEEMAQFIKKDAIKYATHLGRRSDSYKGSAGIQNFQERYPDHIWKPWIEEGRRVCENSARETVLENWDFETAVEEARRIVSAREAANRYFGKKQTDDDVSQTFDLILSALKNYKVTLDSVMFIRVR